MRKFFLITVFVIAGTTVFAQTTDDNYDFKYAMNGRGDQYIRLDLMAFFPLNFGKQLTVGGAIKVGYHRFLNSWLALGGDFMATFNGTRGENVFYALPITFGVTFQPYVWKFEFPITLNVGFAYEASASRKYFPGLVLGADFGVYFRIRENWSFGAGTLFMYLPQWYNDKEEKEIYGSYDYGLFMTVTLSVRYHF